MLFGKIWKFPFMDFLLEWLWVHEGERYLGSDLSRHFEGLEFGLLIGVRWWLIVVCSLLGVYAGSRMSLFFSNWNFI